MTAYASAEKSSGPLTVAAEIRTYNSRHFDLVMRLPHGYTGLEERIKAMANEKIVRGRVELQLRFRETSEEAGAFEFDEGAAASYVDVLNRLRDRFSLQGGISVELVAKAPGIIKPAEIEKDVEAAWPLVAGCLSEALDALDAMRAKEGAFIADDFSNRLEFIGSCIDRIAQSAADLLPVYQQRLTERIEILTRGGVEIDPGRIAQEAAVLADRSDISEEIVRARSHVAQFKETMAGGEPAGRKLNFLLQEFNREFNTMASKAASTEVSHTIVAVRAELEKLREQVQNVE
jgi:uncharacterized protein (TIGR00255 family)